jgi:hypothetical protein
LTRALAAVPDRGGRIDLGISANSVSGIVGTLDAAARINKHVEAIAQGHVGAKDWAAMAGLRVRW